MAKKISGITIEIDGNTKPLQQALKDLNSEIYGALDINENAINKDYLLKEKLQEIKRMNEPITTGNGYVDILLVVSMLVTGIMVILIFGSVLF